MVDEAKLQQMTNQYSDKVKEFDQRWEEYDRRSTTGMPGERDWQKEVEMEDNMRLVADMQIALQREIRYTRVQVLLVHGVCVRTHVWIYMYMYLQILADFGNSAFSGYSF